MGAGVGKVLEVELLSFFKDAKDCARHGVGTSVSKEVLLVLVGKCRMVIGIDGVNNSLLSVCVMR